MKVHIARHHAVGGVPIDNRGTTPALVSPSFHDDVSKFYYNSLLRRFLPVSSSGAISPNPLSSNSDPFQSSINILESVTKLYEMHNELHNFYTSTPKSAFQNPSESQLRSAKKFERLGTNYTSPIPSAITHKYEQTADTLTDEVQGFRVDLCQGCFEIYSISICGNSRFTNEEILRKITTSIHRCGSSNSEVSILSANEKQIRYNKLINNREPFILKKVLDWLQGKRPHLRVFILRSNPLAGCVNFVKPVPYPFGFVNRAIENGHTTLEASELKDFLLLSKFRSTGIYAVINSRPGSKQFPYSCVYGILITRN